MAYIIPSIFTIYRLACIPFFIYFLIHQRMGITLIILVISALSDLLDGAIARRLKVESKIGALMDAAGDKIFVFSALAALVYIHVISWWFLVLVFLKDLTIVAGALILHYSGRKIYFLPTVLGKLSTAFVFACLVAALLYLYRLANLGFVWGVVIISSIIVTLACLDYIIVGYDILKGREVIRNAESVMYRMLSNRLTLDDLIKNEKN